MFRAPRPPQAKPQLLSLVLRRYIVERAGFPDAHPDFWVVWERGSWTPPAADKNTVVRSAAPASEPAGGGDALCFELKGSARAACSFRVGRADESDIAVTDGTVSRTHLVLSRDSEGKWAFQVAPSAKVVFRGMPHIVPGADVAIASGEQLELGTVRLTFYDASGFVQRLEKERLALK